MTVDDALEIADMGGDLPSIALAAEVRRLRAALDEANAVIVEAGFATMSADEVVAALAVSPEEVTRVANVVRDIFARAHAEVMRRKAR
jgi:hypothetical protein